MRKHIRFRHQAQGRTHAVCIEHRAAYEAVGAGTNLIDDVGTNVAEVGRLLVVRERAIHERRAAMLDVRRLRQTVRAGAAVIVRAGKLVTVDGSDSMSTMRVFRSLCDQELESHAMGLVGHVEPYAEAFVAAGMPADLLQRLVRRVQALHAARMAKTSAALSFTCATRSILSLLNRNDEIIAFLEALAVDMPAALNLELLTELRIAKRVGPRAVEPNEEAASSPALALTLVDRAA